MTMAKVTPTTVKCEECIFMHVCKYRDGRTQLANYLEKYVHHDSEENINLFTFAETNHQRIDVVCEEFKPIPKKKNKDS